MGYELARDGSLFGSFDGTFHKMWLQGKDGNKEVGSADHWTSGLNLGVSLFSGVDLNLVWSVAFRSSADQKTLLAAAYQWYSQNLLANYGSSNWAVKVQSKASLPEGVDPLPAHVVAYVAALYDLQTGSDRRRRSGGGAAGSYDGRRRGQYQHNDKSSQDKSIDRPRRRRSSWSSPRRRRGSFGSRRR